MTRESSPLSRRHFLAGTTATMALASTPLAVLANTKPIRIGWTAWADAEAVTNLAKLILEHLIDLKEDGSFWLDQSYFDYCAGLRMTNAKFETCTIGAAVRSGASRLVACTGRSVARAAIASSEARSVAPSASSTITTAG